MATSRSSKYEDNERKQVGLICFWSERSLAKSCIKDDWIDYVPVEISLGDNIEDWCIGIPNEGLLIGTEFNQNMFGFEVDPLDLVFELGKELKDQKK